MDAPARVLKDPERGIRPAGREGPSLDAEIVRPTRSAIIIVFICALLFWFVVQYKILLSHTLVSSLSQFNDAVTPPQVKVAQQRGIQMNVQWTSVVPPLPVAQVQQTNR